MAPEQSSCVTGPGTRPLRRDAERNRLRILAAAQEVFALGGLGVSMDDIAKAAGIGMGTLYRRFPTKEVLIDALFEERVGEVVAIAEEALTFSDGWRGFTFFLERTQSLQAEDRGLVNALFDHQDDDGEMSRCRQRLGPLGEELIRRAQVQGQLRPDVCSTDIPFILLMLSIVTRYTRDVLPDAWSRYLTIVIDGLRTQRRHPTPLPSRPLTYAEVDESVASWSPCPVTTHPVEPPGATFHPNGDLRGEERIRS